MFIQYREGFPTVDFYSWVGLGSSFGLYDRVGLGSFVLTGQFSELGKICLFLLRLFVKYQLDANYIIKEEVWRGNQGASTSENIFQHLLQGSQNRIHISKSSKKKKKKIIVE